MLTRDEAMTRRERKVASRVRQQNQMEKALLTKTIQVTDENEQKRLEQLSHEIRELEIGMENENYRRTVGKNDTSDIEETEVNDKSQSVENDSIVDNVEYGNINNNECKYDASEHNCIHFPCNLPKSYTSIQGRVFDREVLHVNEPKPKRDVTLLKIGIKESSVTRRERALESMIRDLRAKNEKNKPKDRAVKYGAPWPRRKLVTVARPS